MNANSEPVKVDILDRQYQFACPDEEREALIAAARQLDESMREIKDSGRLLIAAARQLDESMREIKDSGRLLSLERIALQAALNYCDETLKLRQSAASRDEKIDSKIRMLADQLDEALSE
jgi:cell division protein ZapA